MSDERTVLHYRRRFKVSPEEVAFVAAYGLDAYVDELCAQLGEAIGRAIHDALQTKNVANEILNE
ncbi:MAG: hypothetical protein IT345_10720 [Trueperaceae bacterium]|nr:hypothetical protein [Trueperaceae bacterium]